LEEAFIYDSVRSPRGKGKSDGSLHELTSVYLSSEILKAIRDRNKLDTSILDDVIWGNVTQIGEQGGCLSRSAVLKADYDQSTPGLSINRFCASGLDGFTRNLEAAEITGQIMSVEEETLKKINNVVFMGMGEPLANLNNLMQAIQIINASWGIGIGARHITVSTSGLVPQIRKIAEQPLQIRLAISLHGASDEVREKIMPVNKKYPISKLFDALHYYKSKKSQKITFEYILIKDVNDSLEQAKKLSKEARSLNAKVNLIPYNTVDGLDWERPSENTQRDFLNVLT